MCFLLFGQLSCELMSLRTKLSSTSVFEKMFITSCSQGKALFMFTQVNKYFCRWIEILVNRFEFGNFSRNIFSNNFLSKSPNAFSKICVRVVVLMLAIRSIMELKLSRRWKKGFGMSTEIASSIGGKFCIQTKLVYSLAELRIRVVT